MIYKKSVERVKAKTSGNVITGEFPKAGAKNWNVMKLGQIAA